MDEKLYAKDLSACQTVFCATRDDQAPLFTAEAVIDRSIKKISLEDYKGKWVIPRRLMTHMEPEFFDLNHGRHGQPAALQDGMQHVHPVSNDSNTAVPVGHRVTSFRKFFMPLFWFSQSRVLILYSIID